MLLIAEISTISDPMLTKSPTANPFEILTSIVVELKEAPAWSTYNVNLEELKDAPDLCSWSSSTPR